MYKGYKKIKDKCKITVEGDKVIFEREHYSPETGETAYVSRHPIEDVAQLDTLKAELQLLMDDIDDLIIDVQKEFDKM